MKVERFHVAMTDAKCYVSAIVDVPGLGKLEMDDCIPTEMIEAVSEQIIIATRLKLKLKCESQEPVPTPEYDIDDDGNVFAKLTCDHEYVEGPPGQWICHQCHDKKAGEMTQ